MGSEIRSFKLDRYELRLHYMITKYKTMLM